MLEDKIMKYLQQIKSFVSQSPEEEKEKQLLLTYLSSFDDVLTRNNAICHLTSSAFVINKTHDKVLCIYHNIYNSWGWVGGHADGDDDLIYVAEKEAKEETSIQNIKLLNKQIISLDIMPVLRHYRKGVYVPSHMHLSAAYLFEADEEQFIQIQKDENSNVAWLTFDELLQKCTESHMIGIYQKIIGKIRAGKKKKNI